MIVPPHCNNLLSINTTITRLGGSYGAKIVLPNQLATAAAVAANKLRRPVRLWLPLEDNMKLFGKRSPYVFDYKVCSLSCSIISRNKRYLDWFECGRKDHGNPIFTLL